MRQQHLLAKHILDFIEGQRRVAFVAQTFDHAGAALFGNLDALAFDLYHVHLQRLDEEVRGNFRS